MLNNLKIGSRIAMGFGAAVLLGVGIAAIATVQMRGLTRQLDEVANDRMVKVAQFNTLKDNLNSIARFSRDILISSDPAVKAEERKKIADLRTETGEILAALDKTIALPKARELLKVIQDSRAGYKRGMEC